MHRSYELVVRQEPKQARMCGVGGKGPCIPILLLPQLCSSSQQPTVVPLIHLPSSSSVSSIPPTSHLPIPSSRIPTTSCLPPSPSQTTTPSCTGSRTVALAAQQVLSSPVSTISKIPSTTIRMPASLSSPTSASAQRVVTVSSSVSLKSLGQSPLLPSCLFSPPCCF